MRVVACTTADTWINPWSSVMAKLDHVAVRVSDLDAAIAFYTDKLGLKLLFRKLDEQQHEAFAFLEMDGGNLELLCSLDARNRPEPVTPPRIEEPYCPHVAIATDDIDALVSTWRRDDIPVVTGPIEIPGMVRWVYTHDPDRNIIEFVQWL
jgi:catechol 2,3-dioxygenase-like lactoylglutathione lyase family enzyme